MADFKAPYKNNNIKWMAGNVKAFGDHVVKETGERWVNQLQNLADTIYNVSAKAYDVWKNVVDNTKNFFTWDAQVNAPKWKGWWLKPSNRGIGTQNNTDGETPSQPNPTPVNWGWGTNIPNVPLQWNINNPIWGWGQPQNWQQMRNADVNISQYWDDSSAKNYNNEALRGGENIKHEGEWVKNSQVAYDPNATIEWLDPNYKYWQEAQIANSNEMNYIARRNDNIASALYNAWMTTIEDVENFLNQQEWFMNSNENERQNTINAIWKRLWQLNATNQDGQPQEEQQRPEMDLGEWQGGVIYGRSSWDAGNRIETQYDQYSAEARALEGRQNNYKNLQGMDSYDIAVSIASWTDPYWSQAMRDLRQYDPQKYQEIQDNLKVVRWEADINSIAKNWTINATSQVEQANNTINNSISSWINQNSNERTASQAQDLLTNKLANSQVANSATQEMLSLNAQMADIQEQMANLPNEAKKVFKGDVPQYLIDAYVANNSARLQSELSKLQARYNWAIDLYKTELSQKQWEAEMDLREREYSFKVNQQNRQNTFQQNQQARNQYYQWRQLELSSIKTDNSGRPYVINSNWTFTYLTDDTFNQAVKQQVQNWINSLMTVRQDWMDGGQCEAFTDSFNRTVYGMEMLPRDAQGNVIQWRTYTTAQEKASYVNTAIPVVWSTAVFNYWPNSNVSDDAKTYWHTMTVVWYDQATWTITMKGSNKDWSCKVYTQTMNINDFYSSRWGVGFRDPAQDMKLQAQSWAVSQTSPGSAMTWVFDKLIQNANTEGKLNTIATAEAMYNTLSELRDNGSITTLITSWDLQKVLAGINQKKFGADDGWTMFAQQLKNAITKKNIDPQSQVALNKLYLLVEMKLRKESGAAISSSEWMSNFEMMLPQAYETKEVQLEKLKNRDEVIKRYARTGGMSYADYVPIFNTDIITRQTW